MFQELMVSLPVSTACKELKLLIKFEHNLYSTDNIELPSITIQITLKKFCKQLQPLNFIHPL